MPLSETICIPASLSEFLHSTDLEYQQSLSLIPLFNPEVTKLWSKEQKRIFASILYHLRGHFINFGWYIANFCHEDTTKQIILNNIQEELGLGQRLSHERLYEFFAEACDADIHDEIINETHYLPFAKIFNKTHLKWLSTHSEEERIAAFAAYERLDNLDYPRLTEMAKSLNLSEQAIIFFQIHVNVTHFDSTLELILPIWKQKPDAITSSFQFIYNHQYAMWNELSNIMFASSLSTDLNTHIV